MRKKIGTVVSTKMQKTIVVAVTDYQRHPKYGKDVPNTKKFHARSEKKFEEGDQVTIQEIKPISKTVCWEVVTN